MFEEKTERNNDVTRLVLQGYTLRQVGSVYSISPERIRQIVYVTIRKRSRKFHRRPIKIWSSLKEMRENKNRIIEML